MNDDARVVCRTPTPGKTGVTRLPKWKFDCVRAAIIDSLRGAGPEGFAFSELSDAVRARLSEDQLARLGSVGWHTVSVKLEMEVRGELRRLPGKGRQMLALG